MINFINTKNINQITCNKIRLLTFVNRCLNTQVHTILMSESILSKYSAYLKYLVELFERLETGKGLDNHIDAGR